MCAPAASVKVYRKFPLQSLKFMAMNSCPLTMPFCMLLITAAALLLASMHDSAHAATHTPGTVHWHECVLRFMQTNYNKEPSGVPLDITWCCMDLTMHTYAPPAQTTVQSVSTTSKCS